MAPGLRLIRGPRPGLPNASGSWHLLAAVLVLGALCGTAVPGETLAWQPEQAWREPWRWFTASWAHLDLPHLLANLAGALVVASFGAAAGCTARDTLAWLLAWPLTHGLLLAASAPQPVMGMSGVLHAGVVVASLALITRERSTARAVGALVLAGLLLKLLGEQPWAAPQRSLPDWSFPVAVLSHATGAAAGLLCATVAWATSGRSSPPTMAP